MNIWKNKGITDLSDAEFLSFLYAERDRENGISQYHGWNNWVLIGAFVSVMCAGYVIVRDNYSCSWRDVLYYSGGMMAYFLLYHSWSKVFKRKRAVDFSKVRMLKEVVPYVHLGFVFLCGIASVVLIATMDVINVTFWWWIAVLSMHAIVLGCVVLLRDKIVHTIFEELFLPWTWVNVMAVFAMSFTLAGVAGKSLRMATSGIFSVEFSIAACVTACLVIAFVFIVINTSSKPIRAFDTIIDEYLYMGVSKEETFHKIVKNRMGCGVLDSCEKELLLIKRKMSEFDKEEKDLRGCQKIIMSGDYQKNDVKLFLRRSEKILNSEQKLLDLSKKLSLRLKEVMSVAYYIKDKTEVEKIFDTNQEIYDKVTSMALSVQEGVKHIKEIHGID